VWIFIQQQTNETRSDKSGSACYKESFHNSQKKFCLRNAQNRKWKNRWPVRAIKPANVCRNKIAIELQFDLRSKMDYYMPRFFETRSRDLLA